MRWMQGWMMGWVLASATTVGAVPFAWIVNQGSDSVSRLDLATNLSLTTSVGQAPFGVAAVPDGSLAFVGNATGSSISILDGDTVSVVATVPLASSPQGLAVTPDGTKLYVARQDGAVDVIDVASATVLGSIPIGSPSSSVILVGAAMHPAGTWVYVAKLENNTMSIAVIDTTLDAVVADVFLSHDGQIGLGVTVSPDGTRVYATFMSSTTLYAVDTATNLLADAFPLSCPFGCPFVTGLVTSLDGSRLYVGMMGAVAVLDTTTGSEVATIPLPDSFPSGVDISPDGSTVYVIDQNAGEIALIDTVTNAQIGTLLAIGLYPTGFGRFIVPGTPPTTTTVSTTTSTSTSTSTTSTTSSTSTSTSTTSSTSSSSTTTSTSTSTTSSTTSSTTTTSTSTTTTSTLAPVPVLAATARTCQTAIAGSWKKFPAKIHKLFTGCFDRVLRDTANGVGTAGASASCVQTLDPGAPSSGLARARSAARVQVLARCGALTPAQVAHPCSATAATMGEVADCVLDRQAALVAATVAAEYGASCSVATAAGLAGLFPTLCGP